MGFNIIEMRAETRTNKDICRTMDNILAPCTHHPIFEQLHLPEQIFVTFQANSVRDKLVIDSANEVTNKQKIYNDTLHSWNCANQYFAKNYLQLYPLYIHHRHF